MTDFPPLDEIPLLTFDGSKPTFSIVKSTNVDSRRKRLHFLEFAAKNEIDDAFKATYKNHYDKDSESYAFPSKEIWKTYWEDILS